MNRTPDIAFDAEWYVETYPDVALSGLDPLEHFQRFGLSMGRAGTPQATPPAPRTRPVGDIHQPAPHSGADTRPPAPQTEDILRLMSGDTEIGRFATQDALGRMASPIVTYARMIRQGAAGVVSLRDTQGKKLDPTGKIPAPEASVIDCGATAWLLDGAYDGARRLRISVSGADLPGSAGPDLHILRAYQADPATPGTLRLVGTHTLSGQGSTICELNLCHALMPILVDVSTDKGVSRDIGLLPFPSLLSGGLHAAERAAHQQGPDQMAETCRLGLALLRELLIPGGRDTAFSIAGIATDPARASGTDPADLDGWLKTVFDLSVRSEAVTEPDRAGAMILTLPPATVPTLGALVSRRLKLPPGMDSAPGPFLLAEANSHRPLWAVALPAAAVSDRPPPVLTPTGPAAAQDATTGVDTPRSWLAPMHLSVTFTTPRRAADIRSSDIALPGAETALALKVTDPHQARQFLSALANQTGATTPQILLRLARPSTPDDTAARQIGDAAQALFPNAKIRTLPDGDGPDLDKIAEALDACDQILMAEDTVTLNDPATLQILSGLLASDPRAASAACALLHGPNDPQTTRPRETSAGLFPTRVSLASAPRLGVATPDAVAALPAATYPVLANTFQLCLVRRAAILETAPARGGSRPAGAADLQFGLDTATADWRSLCTTLVRADIETLPPRDEIDPVGLARLSPGRWDVLLSGITFLERLRG